MIVALIHTGSVSLTKWSIYIDSRGKYAQSRQRRIQRWLNNPRINVHRLYKSLIQAALANWSEESMFLALDTSPVLGGVLFSTLVCNSSWQSFTSSLASYET